MHKGFLDTALKITAVGAVVTMTICVASFGLSNLSNDNRQAPAMAGARDTQPGELPQVADQRQAIQRQGAERRGAAPLSRAGESTTPLRPDETVRSFKPVSVQPTDFAHQLDRIRNQLDGIADTMSRDRLSREDVDRIEVSLESTRRHLEETRSRLRDEIGSMRVASEVELRDVNRKLGSISTSHEKIERRLEENRDHLVSAIEHHQESVTRKVAEMGGRISSMRSELARMRRFPDRRLGALPAYRRPAGPGQGNGSGNGNGNGRKAESGPTPPIVSREGVEDEDLRTTRREPSGFRSPRSGDSPARLVPDPTSLRGPGETSDGSGIDRPEINRPDSGPAHPLGNTAGETFQKSTEARWKVRSMSHSEMPGDTRVEHEAEAEAEAEAEVEPEVETSRLLPGPDQLPPLPTSDEATPDARQTAVPSLLPEPPRNTRPVTRSSAEQKATKSPVKSPTKSTARKPLAVTLQPPARRKFEATQSVKRAKQPDFTESTPEISGSTVSGLPADAPAANSASSEEPVDHDVVARGASVKGASVERASVKGASVERASVNGPSIERGADGAAPLDTGIVAVEASAVPGHTGVNEVREISDVGQIAQVIADNTVDHADHADSAGARKNADPPAREYEIRSTVIHIEATRQVDLEPVGARMLNPASISTGYGTRWTHSAVAHELLRRSSARARAQIAGRDQATVRSDERAELVIGYSCPHCNEVRGFASGDRLVVQAGPAGDARQKFHVSAQSTEDSHSLESFSPANLTLGGPDTFVISEAGIEGTLRPAGSEAVAKKSTGSRLMQRVVVLTVHQRSPDSDVVSEPAGLTAGVTASGETILKVRSPGAADDSSAPLPELPAPVAHEVKAEQKPVTRTTPLRRLKKPVVFLPPPEPRPSNREAPESDARYELADGLVAPPVSDAGTTTGSTETARENHSDDRDEGYCEICERVHARDVAASPEKKNVFRSWIQRVRGRLFPAGKAPVTNADYTEATEDSEASHEPPDSRPSRRAEFEPPAVRKSQRRYVTKPGNRRRIR